MADIRFLFTRYLSICCWNVRFSNYSAAHWQYLNVLHQDRIQQEQSLAAHMRQDITKNALMVNFHRHGVDHKTAATIITPNRSMQNHLPNTNCTQLSDAVCALTPVISTVISPLPTTRPNQSTNIMKLEWVSEDTNSKRNDATHSQIKSNG